MYILTTFCLSDACLRCFARLVLFLYKYFQIAFLYVFNQRCFCFKIMLTQIHLTTLQVIFFLHEQVAQSSLLSNCHTPFVSVLFPPIMLHQHILKREQTEAGAPVFITFNIFRMIFLPTRTMIPTMTPIMIAIMARTRSATPRWRGERASSGASLVAA